jgi:radical SAM protein with 4Fe4S-binding SPASM domain
MIMVPCSFDQQKRYEVSLREHSIEEAWNSISFEQFRHKMRNACPECKKREACLGGCSLMSEIVFCNDKNRKIIIGEEV